VDDPQDFAAVGMDKNSRDEALSELDAALNRMKKAAKCSNERVKSDPLAITLRDYAPPKKPCLVS
jgi:hypothetical protein